MSFGDLFTSGVYSNPYAGTAFDKAQERTRGTRMEVARAFTDWRKANPEATLADVRDFMSMATGGDMTMAPSSMQGQTFQKRLEEQSAEAKAKRIRDEQEKALIEDQKWSQVIEQTFQKKLAENGWNPDAAWTQTQAQIAGNVTDPELKKQFTKRLSAFDPKGHARALSDEFISKNLGAMQQLARDAYLEGLDDDAVRGRLNAWAKRPLDPTDQTINQVLGTGKRVAENERKQEAQVQSDRAFQEEQRERAEDERDQKDADAIAAMRSSGVPEDVIVQRFPNANTLKDKVRASQVSLWQISQQSALAKSAETSEALRSAQISEMQLDETAKALAGGKTGNPVAALVLRQIASNYALSTAQRSALVSAVTSKAAKGKGHEQLMQDAMRAVGQTVAFDDLAKAQINNAYTSRKPLSFSEALAGVEKQRQAEIDKKRTGIQLAMKNPKDELSIGALGEMEQELTADLQGGIDQLYNSAKPSLYGEFVDPTTLAATIARRKQEAQQLLEQVRAAKAKKDAEIAKQSQQKASARPMAVPTTMRNDWR